MRAKINAEQNGPQKKRRQASPSAPKKDKTLAQVLRGIDHPLEVKRLQQTLGRKWSGPEMPELTDAQAALLLVAQEPASVHDDEHLRPLRPMEEHTLLAYLQGEIKLRHPPNFIKATFPVLQRAIIEDYHRHYVEYALTADVLAGVRLGKCQAHRTIIRKIFKHNTRGDQPSPMLERLVQNVKRISFDGAHTLAVVFYSKRLAQYWNGTTLRLQTTTIVFADTTRHPDKSQIGTYTEAQLNRQYAVKVLGAEDLSIVDITLVLTDIAKAAVLDVESPRSEALDIFDNGHFMVRFNQATCPAALETSPILR